MKNEMKNGEYKLEMDVDVGITCWVIFWLTYWIFGGLITWKMRNVRKITHFTDVINVLLINMMWSLLATVILAFIPLRAMTDTHILIKFLLTYFITDIWFYHMHVFSHHPNLYQKIHKMHHIFKEPYALTALYSTGYECVVVNVFSASLGCVIFDIGTPYIYIWYFLTPLNALISHSGIKCSYLIDGYHDSHHMYHNYNFSLSPYLDMIYGTYKSPELKIELKIEVKQEINEEVREEKNLSNFSIDDQSLQKLEEIIQ